MKTGHRMVEMLIGKLIHLFISLVVSIAASGQQADTTKNAIQIQLTDTIKTTASSPQKMFSDIARSLAAQQQFLTISYTDRKVKYRVEDSAKLFPVPGGESRAALFELPDYTNDYILTIKSLVHGIGYKYRMFAPTGVFFDSSFRPTHFLSEKKFRFAEATSFKAIHIETEVIIDKERKEDKYLLIYTLNKTERLYTYSDYSQGYLVALLKHPVIRSPDGKIELELHIR